MQRIKLIHIIWKRSIVEAKTAINHPACPFWFILLRGITIKEAQYCIKQSEVLSLFSFSKKKKMWVISICNWLLKTLSYQFKKRSTTTASFCHLQVAKILIAAFSDYLHQKPSSLQRVKTITQVSISIVSSSPWKSNLPGYLCQHSHALDCLPASIQIYWPTNSVRGCHRDKQSARRRYTHDLRCQVATAGRTGSILITALCLQVEAKNLYFIFSCHSDRNDSMKHHKWSLCIICRWNITNIRQYICSPKQNTASDTTWLKKFIAEHLYIKAFVW